MFRVQLGGEREIEALTEIGIGEEGLEVSLIVNCFFLSALDIIYIYMPGRCK